MIKSYVMVREALQRCEELPGWGLRVAEGNVCKALDAINQPLVMTKPKLARSISIWRKADGEVAPRKGTLIRRGKPDMEVIDRLATPAPFGHGTETKHDTSVRDAKEIDLSDFHVSEGCFPGPVQDLACELLDETEVEAVPYKLVVYDAPSGHFKPHQDTLRSTAHVATIAVVLDTPFEGGELVVHEGGEEKQVHGKAGEGVAFFTDTTHEVRPVTKGRRVSILFNVVRKEPPAAPEPKRPRVMSSGRAPVGDDNYDDDDDDYDDDDDDDYDDEPEENPDDPPWNRIDEAEIRAQPEGGPAFEFVRKKDAEPRLKRVYDAIVDDTGDDDCVAIICFHMYRQGVTPQELKGADKLLYDYFHPLAHITLIPAVAVSEKYLEEDMDEHSVYPLPPSLARKLARPGCDISAEVAALPPVGMCYVATLRSAEVLDQQAYVEYTGNEAQPMQFKYSVTAMALDFQAKKIEREQAEAEKMQALEGTNVAMTEEEKNAK